MALLESLPASYKEESLKCAKKIADWYFYNMSPHYDNNASAGCITSGIFQTGLHIPAPGWMNAFAAMGLMAAFEAFGEEKYKRAVLDIGRYLRSLQIFNPFMKEHYGAIREVTPQTPWCYTRDSLSVAWGYLKLYEFTGDEEYLERARLWGEWLLRKGRDEEGWPYWGIKFDEFFRSGSGDINNDIQGSFQGGSLNYLYHMGRLSGDQKWTGDILINMADFLIRHIQQDSGLFDSIYRDGHKAVTKDPQAGLHKTNDDFCSLGLLCAYKVTGDKKYLNAIEKYVNAAFAQQNEDGSFDSLASIPVLMNILYETGDTISPAVEQNQVQKALDFLFQNQSDGSIHPHMEGGMLEYQNEQGKHVFSRSSGYTLIFLLKFAAGTNNFLNV